MDPRNLIYPQDSPPREEEEHATSEDSPSPEEDHTASEDSPSSEEEEYTASDSEDSSSLSGEHPTLHPQESPPDSLLTVLCRAVVTCFLVGLLSVLIPILAWGLYHHNHE
ncbi:hypothetical protein SESBI_20693 [Sesbania bispinosa]|nr:hypothetical protein SESBI_20693 [Sesbania bispinosa]